jgi:glycerate 2-kinase
MRVLVAPDCFTGTLTAPEAAAAIAEGWLRTDTGGSVDLAPLSDGGPGFVEVLHRCLGGTVVEAQVSGPVGEQVLARLLLTDDGTGYVESAQACGLALVPPDGNRPLEASTAGVAELLEVALGHGARRVVVGVGGTATTDGGRGCVERLGGAAAWPASVELLVATDVDNPLLGGNGAAVVFGPQKGADRDQVAALEQRMAGWAAVNGGPVDAPGAGAGGGLGYGLMLLGGRRVSGVQTVLEAVRLEDRARSADLLLTGEGAFDGTSLQGKVPRGVAWVAQRTARPCVVLAGRVLVGRREFSAAGIDAAYSVEELAGSAQAARARPAELLADLAERVARSWVPRS